MDLLKKIYPDAFRSHEQNPFIVALVIYGLIGLVSGVIFGLLAKLPLVGVIFSAIGTLVGVYALVGVILTILVFVKAIK